ncbi:hypothetical protein Hanom_Chr08g00687231 [Helianthus anomalus]
MAAELMETLKEAITGLSPTTFFTVLAAGVTVYYIVSVFFMRGPSDHRQQHSPISSEQDRCSFLDLLVFDLLLLYMYFFLKNCSIHASLLGKMLNFSVIPHLCFFL